MSYIENGSIIYQGAAPSENIPSHFGSLQNFTHSFGLRPFIVIISQSEVADPSGAESFQLIFATRKEITKRDIDQFMKSITDEKDYPLASLVDYRKAFEYSINSKDRQGRNWATRQAFAGLEILDATAREKGFSIRKEELFDYGPFDEVPGFAKEGYKPIFAAIAELGSVYEASGKTIGQAGLQIKKQKDFLANVA